MKLRHNVFAPLVFLFTSVVFVLPAKGGDHEFVTQTPRQLLDEAATVKNTTGGDVDVLLEEWTYEVDAQSRVTET
ncbi:MAG TPA: hypothetical protein VG897_10685, partial [Terriglobales bacterium]|nr:hypothetical protein [Terriglobales bacterium]